MPKCVYLGCGPIVTKTSKAGNQYLQRCVTLQPIKKDGEVAAGINVYLMADDVNLPDSLNLKCGSTVFLDFNHKGFLEEMRLIPDDR